MLQCELPNLITRCIVCAAFSSDTLKFSLGLVARQIPTRPSTPSSSKHSATLSSPWTIETTGDPKAGLKIADLDDERLKEVFGTVKEQYLQALTCWRSSTGGRSMDRQGSPVPTWPIPRICTVLSVQGSLARLHWRRPNPPAGIRTCPPRAESHATWLRPRQCTIASRVKSLELCKITAEWPANKSRQLPGASAGPGASNE